MAQIKSILLVALFIVSYNGLAQERNGVEEQSVTIVENKDKANKWSDDEIKTIARDGHSGGFGAVSFKNSKFKEVNVVAMGLRGGWIINRSVAIGIEVYGLIPTAKYDGISAIGKSVLLGGYGGMYIEPIFFSNQIVHVTFPIAGGVGWLGYHEDWEQNTDGETDLIDDDVYWYIEPGVSLELNVSKHFRIATGMTKRFTQDLELIQTGVDEFEGMNYFITFKIGKF